MVEEKLHPPFSHYLLNADLSQNIDTQTISEMGISGFTLMEVAGSSAAKKMLNGDHKLTNGIFLCGKGNNGGDALVVARYLLQHDISATVVFISGTDDLSGDAAKNLKLLKLFDSKNRLSIVESWDSFAPTDNFDFIVDGMLGTGLSSEIRGDYAKAVKWINEQPQPVFAMDIPTGLNANSGQSMGCSVNASQTFAFGGRKQGCYINDGPAVSGQTDYCELPFPNSYKDDADTFLLDSSWVSPPDTTPGNHKYNSGVLHIVAGSEGLTGAAIMAAKSAWAEGLGAVILICPRGLLSVYEQNLPSIIKKPIGQEGDQYFKEQHAKPVLNIIQQKESSVLLGPGLGRDHATVSFTKQLLAKLTTDAIIDADGLWCLSQLEQWPKSEQSNWILTPHPGELQRLISKDVSDDFQRMQAVQKLSQDYAVTILSKGMPGIVGTPDGKCYLTNYNTNYFARAGSGDVLAGKVSAFSALGSAADLSCAAALLDGHQKLVSLLENSDDIPEPTDFI